MTAPGFGYDGTTFGYGNPTASAVSAALNAAPNLVSQPSMAIAAAGTADPEAAAQVFSQAQNANAASAALGRTLTDLTDLTDPNGPAEPGE